MIIKLSGIGQLDGEYELEPHPNMKELTAFRKAAGLMPSELADAISGGGIEIVPLYVFTATMRMGRPDLAALVLEVPFDQWIGVDVDDPERKAEEGKLPPASALEEPVSESATD